MPIAAELIDHTATTLDAPPAMAINATYGQHIAQPCVGCHRLEFEGGPIAAGPRIGPRAKSDQGRQPERLVGSRFPYSDEDGVRPDGSNLNPVAMPWPIWVS